MFDLPAHDALQITILEIWIVFVVGFVLLYWLSRSYLRRTQKPPPKYSEQLQQRLRADHRHTTVAKRTAKLPKFSVKKKAKRSP